jgi:site-specific DNA-methyltransferase (adenine-specific)
MQKLNKIINADCMDIMHEIPDKYFELAIVDPPYGIGKTWNKNKFSRYKNKITTYKNNKIPDKKYFDELLRISKYYIIWGANFFNFGWPTKNVIIWDKVCKWEKQKMGEAEIAITNLNHRPISIYKHQWTGALKGTENGKIKTIHPHQKPVALYRWLLQNYAKPGDKIIDTHSGSGSLACACHLEKFEFLAIEKDYDYWKDSVDRLDELRSQGLLF